MYKKIIFPALISFLVVGCAEQQVRQQPQTQVMPVAPKPVYANITLIVGKTTRKEVREILGAPDSLQSATENKRNLIESENWTYRFTEMKKANVQIIQKDCMEFSYTLGDGGRRTHLSLQFEKGKLFGIHVF